jgi:hypothetical protein
MSKQIPVEYQVWRRRVEGQIKHTIHEHPEWFNLSDNETKGKCISSMAKRIIGEIVVGRATDNNAK